MLHHFRAFVPVPSSSLSHQPGWSFRHLEVHGQWSGLHRQRRLLVEKMPDALREYLLCATARWAHHL